MARLLCITLLIVLAPFLSASAQSPLADNNGDGSIESIAFGDSITYGVGDGIAPGTYVEQITDAGAPRGYPLRLSERLNVAVLNAGKPGEELVTAGVYRFVDVVVGSTADTVIIKEGVNDAVHLTPTGDFSDAMQRIINVAYAEGKAVVIATLAPPTQIHESLEPLTFSYSASVRALALLNSLPLVDIEATFYAACPVLSMCSYYNLPEGLHPNTLGYDAIATAMEAGLSQ